MHVLYAESTGEIELSGTAADLSRLARRLRGREPILLDRRDDPAPYDRALSVVTVTLTSGAVHVSVDGDTLRLEGGGRALELLAANIESVADADDSAYHLHIEYPGDEYVAPTSRPLVVALRS
ncbi:hypothetical protein HDA40_007698 [Hamadaea flava]|uniref:Uncharacterized protein n=1 Tax=Hamadaea flava TaxID=1742688 RepID=A0ABV8LXE4_9ACTN|nr:hypothetical protein [Hamadaea flava]MCP2329191.1 hypothetical protein [Hamadaea flava]